MNPIQYERVTQEVEMVSSRVSADGGLHDEFDGVPQQQQQHNRNRRPASKVRSAILAVCGRPRRLRTISRLSDVACSLYGSTMLLRIAGLVPQTIIPAIGRRRFGLSEAEIGLAMGFMGVGKVCSNVPAASSQRLLGDKTTMLLGCGIFVASGAGLACSRSLAELCGWFWLVGCYQAMLQIGRQSWSRVMFRNEIRGRALGLIGGFTRLASIFGPALAGLVAARRPSFALFLTPLFALISLIFLSFLPKERNTAAKPEESSLLGAYRAVLVGPHFRHLASTSLFGLVIFWLRMARVLLIPLASVALRGDEDGDEAVVVVGYVLASSYVVDALVGMFLAGRVMDNYGRKPAAALACIGMAVGFATLGASPTTTAVAVSGVLLGAGNGFSSGLLMTLSTDLAPTNNRGAYLSLFRIASDVGAVAGPDVSGALVGAFSVGVACFAHAGLALCCLVFVFAVLPETLQKETDALPTITAPKRKSFFVSANGGMGEGEDETRAPPRTTKNSLLGAAAKLSRAPLPKTKPYAKIDKPTYSIVDDEEDDDDEEKREDSSDEGDNDEKEEEKSPSTTGTSGKDDVVEL